MSELTEQDALVRAFAERVEALAFELWSEVEWDAEVPGILKLEPGDPRVRDYALRSAHRALNRAAEELRLAVEDSQPAPAATKKDGR